MNRKSYGILSLVITVTVVIFLLGFTFPEPSKKDSAVWPLPPDPPKIAYVMSLETLRDVGIKKSIFKRIVEFVVGKEPLPRIQRPFGLVSDGDGMVYVTDTGLQVVHVFDFEKRKYRQVFKLENEPPPGRLLSPMSIVLDGEDNIYVSDSILNKVFVFDKSGKHLYSIGDKNIFGRPTGLALNTKQKRLYIADTTNHKIWVYDLKGDPALPLLKKGAGSGESALQEGGGPGETSLETAVVSEEAPLGTVEDTGNIPSGEGKDITVKEKVSSSDERLTSFGKRGKEHGELNFPTHMAIDSKGDIYVTDALNFRVQIFNPDGKFITSIGELGSTLGTFSKPKGIGLDRDGNIYVVDNLYDTVQIFNRSGQLLLNFATHGGGKEGLWLPNGIFVDKDNYIFVADTYNERVQIFKYLR